MNGSLTSTVSEFLLDCEARGHSANTLRAYRDALRPFLGWAAEQGIGELEQLSSAHLREYALHCSVTLSPGGAHARLRPLKSWLKWAQQEELLLRDLTKRLPMPRLKRDPLPVVRLADFRKLLAAARVQSTRPLRDTALLTVLFDTGIRASEALTLHLDDVRAEGFLIIRQGKGGKSRSVPIDRQTLRALRTYIRKERSAEGLEPVLFLAQGQAMTRRGLDKLLQRLCQAAGLPRLSAHTFRRGFAVEYLRNGGDVFTLQRIFGHSSLEMSSRYAQLIEDDLKLVHRRASPLRAVQASSSEL